MQAFGLLSSAARPVACSFIAGGGEFNNVFTRTYNSLSL